MPHPLIPVPIQIPKDINPELDNYKFFITQKKERILCNYFHNLNDKYFKLPVDFICSYPDQPPFANRRKHAYLERCIGFYDGACKMICLNMDYVETLSLERLMETVRHEIAHAIVDIRYKKPNEWHGPTWIKVAKLLRVDTKRYVDGEI